MPLLLVLASSCFIAGMTMRLIDPMVPEIARDLATDPHTVALLASAFTFPYALGQPVIGALGDAVGKVRIIKICLAGLTLMLALAALASSIEMLFLARVLGGMAGGGVIPLALALVGDRFAYAERQVSLSYLLMAILSAQIFGVIGAGLVASSFGWRSAVWIVALMSLGALAVTLRYLRPRPNAERPPFSIKRLKANYHEVLQNRQALACYLAVFTEGTLVLGLFPYVATLLEARGAGGLTEAGLVLAGMGLGGILYTFQVRTLLGMAGGMMNLMRVGGLVLAAGFLGIAMAGPWPFEMAAFVVLGTGFYMLHGSVQTHITEVAPDQRGTSMALHAFSFILGQSVGPVLYALGFFMIGPAASILLAGLILAGLGYATAAALEGYAAPAGKG